MSVEVWPVWEPVPGKAWRLWSYEAADYIRAKPRDGYKHGLPRSFEDPATALVWWEKRGRGHRRQQQQLEEVNT